MAGLLHGIRVLELSSELAAPAGKLLAELGAEVVVVEPPGGDPSRGHAPYADGVESPEHSVVWWAFNAGKLGITLDLGDDSGRVRFRQLALAADVVLEAEPPGRLAGLGIGSEALRAENTKLVWTSVTPFGPDGPRSTEPATDITLLAAGGIVWACGYDDHELPPVRGAGQQAYHTASVWAVMGALTALVERNRSGLGQHVDISAHAAVNITTEQSTYEYLVGGRDVQRQTGRHAAIEPTSPIYARSADARWVHTGMPPKQEREYAAMLSWITELGLRDDFPESGLLELAIEQGGINPETVGDDPLQTELFRSGREALTFLASRLSAYDFFAGAQTRGLATSIIYTPEETFDDPHFAARGFGVQVHYPQIGRDIRYPGPPLRMSTAPWSIPRPAPAVGEHNDQIDELFRAEREG
jgi:benzylsuccinate CoA-transferase BbsE subunit